MSLAPREEATNGLGRILEVEAEHARAVAEAEAEAEALVRAAEEAARAIRRDPERSVADAIREITARLEIAHDARAEGLRATATRDAARYEAVDSDVIDRLAAIVVRRALEPS